MDEILDTLERAAHRCRKVADEFRALLDDAAPDPECAVRLLLSARRTYWYVRAEILPQLEAVTAVDNDPRVAQRVRALKRSAGLLDRHDVRDAFDEKARARVGVIADEPEVRHVLAALADVYEGGLVGVELESTAEALQFLHRYLRAKHTIADRPPSSTVATGDIVMGSKHNTNITHSTVGAVAVGDGAAATGSVSIHLTSKVSQAAYESQVDNARKALIDDEPRLEEVATGLSEALTQFLRIARQIQVDQMSIKDAHAKMKETLDEVWAEQVAPKIKGRPLPPSLEVVKTLLASPLTAAVAKALLLDHESE